MEIEIETKILHWMNTEKNTLAVKYDLNTSFNETTGFRNNLSKFRLRGFADIIVYYTDDELELPFCFFIEVKTEKGVQSKHQKAFEIKVNKMGFSYYLCRSLEEAKRVYAKERILNREKILSIKSIEV